MYTYSMSPRRTYSITPITVNDLQISEVIIDSHYEENHSDLNDEIILVLVRKLDGRFEAPEATDEQYSYFATLLELNSKQYRLVWLLEDHAIYIGIVNVYRDDRKERK